MSILYTRFAPRMLRVISRYVQDTDSAHDILHDGFIAAFTRLDSLREPERLEFWLATIMKSLSLKYLQAQSVSSILDEIPETAEEPELDDIIDFATLESLIRQLPEGYQKVFRLAVLENKSHKEISEILGIAPNSSSSQLFHAKVRLRELIKDYKLRTGLLTLLTLIGATSLWFHSRKAGQTNSPVTTSADSVTIKQNSTPAPPRSSGLKGIIKSSFPSSTVALSQFNTTVPHLFVRPIPNVESSQIEEPSKRHEVIPDTTATKALTLEEYDSDKDLPEEEYHTDRLWSIEKTHMRTKTYGWTAAASFDPGLSSFAGLNENYDSATVPGGSDQPPYDPEEEGGSSFSKASRANPSEIGSYLMPASRRHHLPISFVLSAETQFSSWLGVESGFGYSYLHTDFERYSTAGSELSTCHWHYIDLPLKINLYAYTSHTIKLYGSLGGKVSIPVYSYAQIASNPYCQSGSFRSKPVWSLGASFGVAYRLSKRIDIFVEPSLRYHFPQDAAIPNIWTDDSPWSVSLPIGFRLSW